MADEWANLPTAALNGIEFPVAQRRVRGGRALARRRYPFRDGQTTEDTGREPRSYEFEIPLFAGMASYTSFPIPLYPDAYNRLVELCESAESLGYAELLDPEHGVVQVKITHYEWSESATARNGGILSITCEEEGASAFALFTVSTDPPAYTLGRAVDVDLLAASWSVPIVIPAGFASVVEWAGAIIDAAAAPLVAASSIAAQLDAFRSSMAMIVQAAASLPASAYRLAWSAVLVVDSITLAVQRATDAGPYVVEWVVPAPMSSHEIAVALYGDGSRYGEIEQRNPTINPIMYPTGATLLVAAR